MFKLISKLHLVLNNMKQARSRDMQTNRQVEEPSNRKTKVRLPMQADTQSLIYFRNQKLTVTQRNQYSELDR